MLRFVEIFNKIYWRQSANADIQILVEIKTILTSYFQKEPQDMWTFPLYNYIQKYTLAHLGFCPDIAIANTNTKGRDLKLGSQIGTGGSTRKNGKSQNG